MKKLLLFIAVFALLTASIGYLWFHRVTSKVFVPPSPKKAEAKLPDTLAGYFKQNIPFNIAVFGYGGGTHEGTYLTDTILVAHVDPKAKKVFLVSIPRDIWVFLPTNGNNGQHWKINAAYALGLDDRGYPDKLPEYSGDNGAGNMAKFALQTVTGLDIPYFVALDFDGFTHSIDTLGGVDINVSPAFTDPLYPITGMEEDLCGHTEEEIPDLDAEAATTSAELVWPCRYETLQFDAGYQHMDGETALKYVRSRHSKEDGSDFGRALRQQKLLLAVKQKIFSIGFVSRVIPFLDSLGNDFKTDLQLSDVKTLIEHASELNDYEVETLALTDDNYLVQTRSDNGQNILASIDGVDRWDSIHTWLANTFAGKPVPVLPVVKVINGTKAPGLAQHAGSRLESEGFKTVQPENAAEELTHTTVTIYNRGITEAKLDLLRKEFNVNRIYEDTTATPSGYNIVVTLGTDYQPFMTASPDSAK